MSNNLERNHSQSDIDSRIYWDIKDSNDYMKILQKFANTTIYTDILGKEETYEKVISDLGL